MKFYKAKWEASTPTKVQVNVPTNTDFMVGTELYVKGEKKEVTAENVKLIDTIKYPVQYSFTTASSDLADYAKVSNKNVWTLKQPILLKSNLKSSDNFTTCSVVDDGTVLNVTKGDGTPFVSVSDSNTMIAANINDENNTEICRLILVNLGRIADGVPGKLYYALYSYLKNDFVSEFEIPAGAKFQSTTYWDPATDNTYNRFETWTYEYKTSDVLQPDTSVNGIPAFTMKSLNAEADKLYDVEFKSEAIGTDVALSASSDLLEYDKWDQQSGQVYVTKKDIVLIPPYYQVDGQYLENEKYTEHIKMLGTTNGTNEVDWLNGTVGSWMTILISFNIDGTSYKVQPVRSTTIINAGLNPDGKQLFVVNEWSGASVKQITVPAGTQFNFAKPSSMDAHYSYVKYFELGETYDYKFKLFINEDELAYGDIDLKGLTEAEVSEIVDDAITDYDSQLSTVNLSGTFDDDSTFSYNFVIKN